MDGDPLRNKERLLFGSGFVFGVMFTLTILMVVVATVARDQGRDLLGTDTFLTLGASVFFAAVVGAGMFLLAFPENAVKIPLGDSLHDPDRMPPGDGPGGDSGPTDDDGTADATDGEPAEAGDAQPDPDDQAARTDHSADGGDLGHPSGK